MTEITQADRELLAAEQDEKGHATAILAGLLTAHDRRALRAIAAARRQGQVPSGGEVVAWMRNDPRVVEDVALGAEPPALWAMKGWTFVPLYTSPPSAPVGVVGVVDGPDRGGSISQSATLLRPMPSGTKLYTAPTSVPVGVGNEVRAAAQELVNMIRSIPESDLLALDDDPHPPSSLSVLVDDLESALAQQPAAVDGFDAWFDEYSKQNYSEEMLAKAAWDAALAAQQEGALSERP